MAAAEGSARVRRECSLELEQSKPPRLSFSAVASLSLSLSPPFHRLPLRLSSSLLLCSMNPRGVSSRNITHGAPRLPVSLHPLSPVIPLHHGVHPLCPPTKAIPRPPSAALASRPRNIKPTPPYFSSNSMESLRGGCFLFFECGERCRYIELAARSRRPRHSALYGFSFRQGK